MSQALYHEQEAAKFQAMLDKQQRETQPYSDEPLKSEALLELEVLLLSLIRVHRQLAEYCRRSKEVEESLRQKHIQWALRQVVNRPVMN